MKRIGRVVGPILVVAVLTACGASSMPSAIMTPPEHSAQCWKGGTECRWDNQCCSGRCYVDTGCNG